MRILIIKYGELLYQRHYSRGVWTPWSGLDWIGSLEWTGLEWTTGLYYLWLLWQPGSHMHVKVDSKVSFGITWLVCQKHWIWELENGSQLREHDHWYSITTVVSLPHNNIYYASHLLLNPLDMIMLTLHSYTQDLGLESWSTANSMGVGLEKFTLRM